MSILGAAGAVVGGLTTIGGWLGVGQKRADNRQVDQQKRLNEVNANTAKEMADYEQKLKYDMWDKTNMSAQLQQAKKAGVSKAAAIGGSGGGTQGASVGSVGGGSAADAASTQQASNSQSALGLQTVAQLGLLKAQKENIEADTENKKAEATGKGIDNEVKGDTREDSKDLVREAARKLFHEANTEGINQTVGENTAKAREDKAIAEAVGAGLDNEVKKGTIKLNAEQIKEIKAKIAQGWKGLEFQGTDKVTGKYIEELVNAAKGAFKGKK